MPAIPTSQFATMRKLVSAWSDIDRLGWHSRPVSTFKRSQDGTHKNVNSSWVLIRDMSPVMVGAVIAAEDPHFFRHNGVLWLHMAWRVVEAQLNGTRITGVSTISQQLARNLYLSDVRSIKRKIAEALLAMQLERKLAKDLILELYLNVVEWGPEVWGVESAASHYFNVSASALNPFQAVVLAAMLPAPTAQLSGRNLQRVLDSARRSLTFLYSAGILTLDEWQETNWRIAGVAALSEMSSASLMLRKLGEHPYKQDPSSEAPSIAELLRTKCGQDMRIAFSNLYESPDSLRVARRSLPNRWRGFLP